MNDVEVYSLGLVNASVCAPGDMTREEIAYTVNQCDPTGIMSRWEISDAETFANGQPHPCPCEHNPDRTHYLLTC